MDSPTKPATANAASPHSTGNRRSPRSNVRRRNLCDKETRQGGSSPHLFHCPPGLKSLTPRPMYISPETRARLEEADRRAGHLFKFLNVTHRREEIVRLEGVMAEPGF